MCVWYVHVCLSIWLFVCLGGVCLSIGLCGVSVCLPVRGVCLSVCPSACVGGVSACVGCVCLSVRLPVWGVCLPVWGVSVCPSGFLPVWGVCLLVWLSVCLCWVCLSVCPSVCVGCVSVCISDWLTQSIRAYRLIVPRSSDSEEGGADLSPGTRALLVLPVSFLGADRVAIKPLVVVSMVTRIGSHI